MIAAIFKIAGSLGLFLYGMKLLSDGLQKSAGDRIHAILNIMTGNRIAAILSGFLITGIIQSSSATTVMIVSFVNAGLLNLTQATGLIMGANIGTTVTGWLVAIIGFKFNITSIALPAIGIGLPLIFIKKLKKSELGETLIGFGVLFIGLDFLKNSVPDIRSNPQVLEFLSLYTDMGFLSYLIFVVAGIVITVIIQSSSAAMAITITMAHAGWIDYPTAAALILGENIGTTITALLASIGTQVDARRAAWIHTFFNVAGVVWMSIFFKPFLTIVDKIVPGDIWSPNSVEFLPAHLAMFHTLFNAVNTVLFIGFIPQIAKLPERLIKPRSGEIPLHYDLKYLSAPMQDTAELNILNARNEIVKMAGVVEDMFLKFSQAFTKHGGKIDDEVEEMKRIEDYTDEMQEKLSSYLVLCTQGNLNEKSAGNVNALLKIVYELESIGDSSLNLMLKLERKFDKKLSFSKKSMEEIAPYMYTVSEFLRFVKEHVGKKLNQEDLEIAMLFEKQVNKGRASLKKSAQKRLQDGAEVKGEILYIDMVEHIEKIGDYLLDVAECLRQL